MCEPIACSFVATWRPLLEVLYFATGILLIAGVGFAYLAYRSTRQLATYRNTIDKFATYRNERDANQIARVRELIESGALAGPSFVPGSIGPGDLECLRFVLNEWEEIALCVKYGIYSEQILFEHYGRLGQELWQYLRPFMRHEQSRRPSKWAEFDRLAVLWMIRTSKPDQEPALRRLRELTAETTRPWRRSRGVDFDGGTHFFRIRPGRRDRSSHNLLCSLVGELQRFTGSVLPFAREADLRRTTHTRQYPVGWT